MNVFTVLLLKQRKLNDIVIVDCCYCTGCRLWSKNEHFLSKTVLKNWQDWSPELVVELAKRESLDLLDAHWDVILFIRQFYLNFNTSPTIRMLVKSMADKFAPEKANSRYLQQLFPKGPAKQAVKLAGLPRPVRCL